MAVKLRKPILVGGLGVSFGLWLWWNIQDSLMEVGEFGLLAVMALGGGFWLLKRRVPGGEFLGETIASVNREKVEAAIAQVRDALAVVQAEAPDFDSAELQQATEQLPQHLERKTLQIAVTGGKNTGKTSLMQLLQKTEFSVPEEVFGEGSWLETEALFAGEDSRETAVKEAALAADAVVFVVSGDLTDSELRFLQELKASNQRILLAFNQQDRYIPEERTAILQQLRHRLGGIVAAEDAIAISAAPGPMKVRQHQEDSSVEEWLEVREPEIQGICDRLTAIVSQEREALVYQTTWREALHLKARVKSILNQVRRDRAVPIIEQYQWIAAAAAFANPVAALDLLATAAISAQLLVDLGAIYQQKFSLSQAQTASATIGQLMVKLGLVELSTQTIGAILKSNAVTYVAGGAVQGVSAAYLTRLAGLSLIEYFQEQELSTTSGEEFNRDRLGKTLEKIFQQNQRTAFFQGFVRQAMARLSRDSSQAAGEVGVAG